MIKAFALSFASICILLTATQASADLVIDVTGIIGSGTTTWDFSTVAAGVAEADGSVRDNTATNFNGADTGQFPFGEDTILDTSIQDQVFTLTGNAEITIAGNTESLSGIFLDDDGGSADDLGVRVANELAFLQNDLTTWTGSGTMNLDISTFGLGTWSINDVDGQRLFISEVITVNFTAVPEPTGLGVLASLGYGIVLGRRRKNKRISGKR